MWEGEGGCGWMRESVLGVERVCDWVKVCKWVVCVCL